VHIYSLWKCFDTFALLHGICQLLSVWLPFNACCCTVLQAAKSEVETQKRMALLKPRGTAAAAARPRADVVLMVKTSGGHQQVGERTAEQATFTGGWASTSFACCMRLQAAVALYHAAPCSF
jgi:hypothetical protein